MTYQETLKWMYAQLPMYQRIGNKAFKKNLTNILAFSSQLNFPEKKFKSIHIAGTNGKGSTSHMLASILQEAGYKTGLYTSPHLKDFRERIKINGQCIPKRKVSSFISKHQNFLIEQELSFFEMTVGMAFYYFAENEVDIAVIEVGLGGRLDSTNIIVPEVSIITNIGKDHVSMLGNTIRKIASEKAGIIKPNIPVIIGEKQKETTEIFKKFAIKNNAEIHFASDRKKDIPKYELLGNYQTNNVKTVLKGIEVLKEKGFKIENSKIESGLMNTVKNTSLRGRWEQIQKEPFTIADTAHNEDGLRYTMNQIKENLYDNLHMVIGLVNDKDLDQILPLFPKTAIYYFCQANIPRALNKEILKEKAATYGLYGETYSSVKQAFSIAKKNALKNDFIYIGGSTFVVAEVI